MNKRNIERKVTTKFPKISWGSAVLMHLQRTQLRNQFRYTPRVSNSLLFLLQSAILALRKRKTSELYFRNCRTEVNLLEEVIKKIKPARVLDIGGGIALYHLDWLMQNKEASLTVLDKSRIELSAFSFGFSENSRFYSSINVAKRELLRQGVAAHQISMVEDKSSIEKIEFDIIVSFYSAGFHYPLNIYQNLIEISLSDKGVLIVDFRKGSEEDLEKFTKECQLICIHRVNFQKSERIFLIRQSASKRNFSWLTELNVLDIIPSEELCN